MFRHTPHERQAAQLSRDARLVTRELAETLSVLVMPALLFSSVSLFLR